VDWRVQWQQRDGLDLKEFRENPRFLSFLCGDIRSSLDENGRPYFAVERDPVAKDESGPGSPANPAHCGVRSTTVAPMTRAEKREKVAELRNKLLKIVLSVLNYDEVFCIGEVVTSGEVN
jgi:hypothetical protein